MSIINILLTIYAPSSCLAYANSAAICVAIVLFMCYVIGILFFDLCLYQNEP